MFRRAIIQIVRLSAIIQVLENAFKICNSINVENKLLLSSELEIKLKTEINNRNLSMRIISYETLRSAKELMEYFLLNQLILAGYNCYTEGLANGEIIKSTLKIVKNKNL